MSDDGYHLLVSIPHDAPPDDIRRQVMMMAAARTFPMRQRAARVVLASDSEHVTDDHRDLARAVLNGRDALTLKGLI